MKKVFSVLILMLALSAPFAFAQVPTYAPQTLYTTTVTAGATSNSVFAVLDCRKQQNVALMIKVSGCTNWTANLSASVDGIIYDTNHYSIGGTGAGAPIVTNITVAGFGFLRLDSFSNVGSINATNNWQYGVKISAP